MPERINKPIAEVHQGDIHEIVRWFGEDVVPLDDQTLGIGFRFTANFLDSDCRVEIYTQFSTLRFISAKDTIELRNVACPAVNQKAIIFSGLDNESVSRYLAISKDGEVVYYRGPKGPHADSAVPAYPMPVPPALEAIIELLKTTRQEKIRPRKHTEPGQVIEEDGAWSAQPYEPGQVLPPFSKPRKILIGAGK